MKASPAGPSLFALAFLLACSKGEQPAAEGGPVWAVLSSDGGSLTATGADGTRFVLTIPKGALLGPEEITLSPVASVTGLPVSAFVVAAVQLAPDDLELLEPATLEITPPKPLDRKTAFPVAWNGGGRSAAGAEDLRLYPLNPRAGDLASSPRPVGGTRPIRFEVMHFSGFAIASGSDAAMNEILKNKPQRCGERYFREVDEALNGARRAVLMGEEGGLSKAMMERVVQISKTYLADVLQPSVTQISKDGAILPCVRAELLSFDRTFRAIAGDSLAGVLFSKPLVDAWLEVFTATGAAFIKAAALCKQKQNPLFQFYAMSSLSRLLWDTSFEDLLPRDWQASVDACGKSLQYQVGIKSTIENKYRSEGRANDFSSSKTTIEATGISVVYSPERSKLAGTPTFISLKRVPLGVSETAVPRKACPDKVRFKPGSYMEVTLMPLLNPRVSKLICSGGKVRCEPSDFNPDVMVQLAPNVYEEMLVHTKTSAGCTRPGAWREYTTFSQGSEATGANEPFRVRGNQQADTVVRRGTGTRGYVTLPDIESSVSTTRAVVEVVR